MKKVPIPIALCIALAILLGKVSGSDPEQVNSNTSQSGQVRTSRLRVVVATDFPPIGVVKSGEQPHIDPKPFSPARFQAAPRGVLKIARYRHSMESA